MKRRVLLVAALLAAGSVHAACERGGLGGTGIRADGGIGGTGIQADGEIGLIGVITAFGSICVNGIEVNYEASTPVTTDGAAASPASLAIGQLVAVRARASGAQVRARDIQILDAVVGRASAVDPATGQLQVAGQRVRLEPSTVLAGISPAELAGASIRVSGLWRVDGSVAATRVERALPDAAPRVGAREWPDLGTPRFVVEGFVADVAPRSVRVGGLAFSAEPRATREMALDQRVRVSGRVERDGSRVIERVDFERLERGGPERSGRDVGGRERGVPGRADRPDRGERGDRPERPDRSGRI